MTIFNFYKSFDIISKFYMFFFVLLFIYLFFDLPFFLLHYNSFFFDFFSFNSFLFYFFKILMIFFFHSFIVFIFNLNLYFYWFFILFYSIFLFWFIWFFFRYLLYILFDLFDFFIYIFFYRLLGFIFIFFSAMRNFVDTDLEPYFDFYDYDVIESLYSIFLSMRFRQLYFKFNFFYYFSVSFIFALLRFFILLNVFSIFYIVYLFNSIFYYLLNSNFIYFFIYFFIFFRLFVGSLLAFCFWKLFYFCKIFYLFFVYSELTWGFFFDVYKNLDDSWYRRPFYSRFNNSKQGRYFSTNNKFNVISEDDDNPIFFDRYFVPWFDVYWDLSSDETSYEEVVIDGNKRFYSLNDDGTPVKKVFDLFSLFSYSEDFKLEDFPTDKISDELLDEEEWKDFEFDVDVQMDTFLEDNFNVYKKLMAWFWEQDDPESFYLATSSLDHTENYRPFNLRQFVIFNSIDSVTLDFPMLEDFNHWWPLHEPEIDYPFWLFLEVLDFYRRDFLFYNIDPLVFLYNLKQNDILISKNLKKPLTMDFSFSLQKDIDLLEIAFNFKDYKSLEDIHSLSNFLKLNDNKFFINKKFDNKFFITEFLDFYAIDDAYLLKHFFFFSDEIDHFSWLEDQALFFDYEKFIDIENSLVYFVSFFRFLKSENFPFSFFKKFKYIHPFNLLYVFFYSFLLFFFNLLYWVFFFSKTSLYIFFFSKFYLDKFFYCFYFSSFFFHLFSFFYRTFYYFLLVLLSFTLKVFELFFQVLKMIFYFFVRYRFFWIIFLLIFFFGSFVFPYFIYLFLSFWAKFFSYLLSNMAFNSVSTKAGLAFYYNKKVCWAFASHYVDIQTKLAVRELKCVWLWIDYLFADRNRYKLQFLVFNYHILLHHFCLYVKFFFNSYTPQTLLFLHYYFVLRFRLQTFIIYFLLIVKFFFYLIFFYYWSVLSFFVNIFPFLIYVQYFFDWVFFFLFSTLKFFSSAFFVVFLTIKKSFSGFLTKINSLFLNSFFFFLYFSFFDFFNYYILLWNIHFFFSSFSDYRFLYFFFNFFFSDFYVFFYFFLSKLFYFFDEIYFNTEISLSHFFYFHGRRYRKLDVDFFRHFVVKKSIPGLEGSRFYTPMLYTAFNFIRAAGFFNFYHFIFFRHFYFLNVNDINYVFFYIFLFFILFFFFYFFFTSFRNFLYFNNINSLNYLWNLSREKKNYFFLADHTVPLNFFFMYPFNINFKIGLYLKKKNPTIHLDFFDKKKLSLDFLYLNIPTLKIPLFYLNYNLEILYYYILNFRRLTEFFDEVFCQMNSYISFLYLNTKYFFIAPVQSNDSFIPLKNSYKKYGFWKYAEFFFFSKGLTLFFINDKSLLWYHNKLLSLIKNKFTNFYFSSSDFIFWSWSMNKINPAIDYIFKYNIYSKNNDEKFIYLFDDFLSATLSPVYRRDKFLNVYNYLLPIFFSLNFSFFNFYKRVKYVSDLPDFYYFIEDSFYENFFFNIFVTPHDFYTFLTHCYINNIPFFDNVASVFFNYDFFMYKMDSIDNLLMYRDVLCHNNLVFFFSSTDKFVCFDFLPSWFYHKAIDSTYFNFNFAFITNQDKFYSSQFAFLKDLNFYNTLINYHEDVYYVQRIHDMPLSLDDDNAYHEDDFFSSFWFLTIFFYFSSLFFFTIVTNAGDANKNEFYFYLFFYFDYFFLSFLSKYFPIINVFFIYIDYLCFAPVYGNELPVFSLDFFTPFFPYIIEQQYLLPLFETFRGFGDDEDWLDFENFDSMRIDNYLTVLYYFNKFFFTDIRFVFPYIDVAEDIHITSFFLDHLLQDDYYFFQSFFAYDVFTNSISMYDPFFFQKYDLKSFTRFSFFFFNKKIFEVISFSLDAFTIPIAFTQQFPLLLVSQFIDYSIFENWTILNKFLFIFLPFNYLFYYFNYLFYYFNYLLLFLLLFLLWAFLLLFFKKPFPVFFSKVVLNLSFDKILKLNNFFVNKNLLTKKIRF